MFIVCALRLTVLRLAKTRAKSGVQLFARALNKKQSAEAGKSTGHKRSAATCKSVGRKRWVVFAKYGILMTYGDMQKHGT